MILTTGNNEDCVVEAMFELHSSKQAERDAVAHVYTTSSEGTRVSRVYGRHRTVGSQCAINRSHYKKECHVVYVAGGPKPPRCPPAMHPWPTVLTFSTFHMSTFPSAEHDARRSPDGANLQA